MSRWVPAQGRIGLPFCIGPAPGRPGLWDAGGKILDKSLCSAVCSFQAQASVEAMRRLHQASQTQVMTMQSRSEEEQVLLGCVSEGKTSPGSC